MDQKCQQLLLVLTDLEIRTRFSPAMRALFFHQGVYR